jgi:hypothetical protein
MPLSQINRRGGHIQVSPPSFFRVPPSNELLLHGTQLWVGKDENGSLVVEVWPADRVQQLEAKRAAEQAHTRSLAEQKRRQGGGRPIIGDGLPPDLTHQAHHQRNLSYGEARIEAVSFLKPKKPESKLFFGISLSFHFISFHIPSLIYHPSFVIAVPISISELSFSFTCVTRFVHGSLPLSFSLTPQ